MIGEVVSHLQFEKKIQNPWHVCIVYAEDSLETGFSIEPNTKNTNTPNLESMQNDAQGISDHLVSGIRHLAKKYIEKYQHPPSR